MRFLSPCLWTDLSIIVNGQDREEQEEEPEDQEEAPSGYLRAKRNE